MSASGLTAATPAMASPRRRDRADGQVFHPGQCLRPPASAAPAFRAEVAGFARIRAFAAAPRPSPGPRILANSATRKFSRHGITYQDLPDEEKAEYDEQFYDRGAGSDRVFGERTLQPSRVRGHLRHRYATRQADSRDRGLGPRCRPGSLCGDKIRDSPHHWRQLACRTSAAARIASRPPAAAN